MNTTSDVLVLIPHYNNFKGLLESIKVIDEEERIDVLIVDDGSTTSLINEQELRLVKSNNLNIIFLYLDQNKGIEYALNEGIEYFKNNGEYKFLARLDCGDLCKKSRLKIQKQFLINNPKVGIVGSYINFFNLNKENVFKLKLPQKDSEIRKGMYLNAMFIHPSIMMKAEVFDKVKKYPVDFPAAEDYALFFEILKYFEGANINQYLVACELNPNGISIQKRKTQLRSRLKLIKKNFYFGIYPIFGFFRNLLLYVMPYKIIVFLKSKLN